jgi:MoaA/NifB/PqqE/SkfB family radical SAM enzyme
MIAMVVERDMGPALITNGWLLPSQLEKLAATGLKTVYISIDAATIAKHEANRGLAGLGQRIRTATSGMRELGMTPLAQVTMSKLLGDSLYHLRKGPLRAATKTLMDRRNFVSLGAVLENAHVLTRLARLG